MAETKSTSNYCWVLAPCPLQLQHCLVLVRFRHVTPEAAARSRRLDVPLDAARRGRTSAAQLPSRPLRELHRPTAEAGPHGTAPTLNPPPPPAVEGSAAAGCGLLKEVRFCLRALESGELDGDGLRVEGHPGLRLRHRAGAAGPRHLRPRARRRRRQRRCHRLHPPPRLRTRTTPSSSSLQFYIMFPLLITVSQLITGWLRC